MSDEDKTQHDSEYQKMLALFIALLKKWNTSEREEALYELAEQRAENTISHVLKGLNVDYDYAIQLLQNSDTSNLSQHDKDLTDRLKVAVDNLIDFSVCEEYQLYDEVWEQLSDANSPDDLDIDLEDYEDFELFCEKYNDTYAAIEDSDIEYAGFMAAWWITLSEKDYIVYWTQNDALVRPWHMALQGYTAPRDEFPSWMIPPIEYNCRCYLESLEYPGAFGKAKRVMAKANEIAKPKQLSNVYSESLAKCGRIFSAEHPYFSVKEKDKGVLKGFVERLKEKYYGSGI